MKKFTVFGMALILTVFCCLMVFVNASPDFVPPTKPTEPPVDVIGSWDKTMDDLLTYLSDLGLIDLSTKNPISAGIGTEAFVVSGLEIYWWDVDNLNENSDEYYAYQDMVNEGIIDLWGAGLHFMPVIQNGPFGIFVGGYTGNSDAVIAAFEAFARNDGSSATLAVWSKTLDDLFAYLEEKGLIDLSTKALLSPGVSTEAFKVSGAEFSWWDVENLVEGSPEYIAYQEMNEEGVIDLWGAGMYYQVVIPNGPFGLNIDYYDGDVAALEEAFKAFGQEVLVSEGADSNDMTTGVWLKNLDELEAFLMDKGVLNKDMNRISINFGMDAEGVAGYRYDDRIDLYWYDVPNMSEDNTYLEKYQLIKENGIDTDRLGNVYEYYVNGPFLLHFYFWSKDPLPENEQGPIIEAFKEFQ